MDVTLRWIENTGNPDMALEAGDVTLGDGLVEAVILSLFTDARAPADMDVPGDRRGWWGDGDAQAPRPLGSLLWTLAREKETDETRLRARDYARQALAWMPASDEPAVADVVGVAVDAWWAARGMLGLSVMLTLRGGSNRALRFEHALADGQVRRLGAM